jgi:hypothetical protein
MDCHSGHLRADLELLLHQSMRIPKEILEKKPEHRTATELRLQEENFRKNLPR